ncbi:hypothetical protein BJY16_005361 [Actinoplanes octamycinicus]|uniref:Membrane-associated oxidoreductase n=1 Tax=Actinoplanes octamycinicus TaxID=135948 RepID=A0A7W7M9G4_9ACTN|nr:hypothetical protein [Actinoplanes octamycinicus]MBB4741902.1 hypothetical protein [Actinoplanes octamycinicus]GIE60665.1 hypothetical protein Aoc01nite_60670 [Actinoplanes octamycinicus]
MIGLLERRLRRAFRAGAALDLDGAAVRADLLSALLVGGDRAVPGRTARLDLSGARITGRLDLTGARIDSPVRLRRCVFDEVPLLDHAELAQLNLDGSELPGIEADGLRVTGDLGLRDATVTGDLWLLPARVGGSVELDRSTVAGTVYLQRSEVGGHLRLVGATIDGELRLNSTRLGGDLDLGDARIGGLFAAGLQTGGSVMAHRLRATGPVNLIGAQVAGTIAVVGSTLTGPAPDGHALLLIEARTGLLTLRPGPGSAGTISLRDARVGRLADDPAGWPAGCPVELDGLTYERLTRRSEDVSEWTVSQRLAWMTRHATGFAPGPYDQLAAALRRDGREQDARQALVVRERLRHRAMGRLGAVWGALQDATIGFGYRPGRALLWLLTVVTASTAWFAWSGPLQPVKPGESPTWDPFLYSLDVLVPLVSIGHDQAWDPVGADKAVTVAVMAAGWILATTVIAGVGRSLRR